jgi:hypothetical protein
LRSAVQIGSPQPFIFLLCKKINAVRFTDGKRLKNVVEIIFDLR